MNNLENQATDVNNARSSDESNEASHSNANNVINDQNNQDMFKEWCEEDGDFEIEVMQQQGDHHETQPPSSSSPQQQPVQLNGNGGFDFNDNMVNSGQNSSLNDDDQTTNNVMGGEKQNNEEEVEASQSSTTNKNNDDTVHFEEDLDDMMTDEIGKTNIGNLYTAQNSEVPVQSVLIDQKDVVTLEDEIIKSQSPEKVQKSKQSPQKGKQKKGAKKSKTDTELSATEGTKTTPIKNNNDQGDDQNDHNDPLDSDHNDPKTKSGRKIQKPEYFNPTNFGRGRRRSSFEPLANEPLRKTKRQGKRRKSKGKDIIVSQESENVLSDPNNPPGIYMDAEEDNIVCTICRDGTSVKQNWIVFCDKCDAPYHQLCHKPRIEDIVVEDSQTEWICAKCKISPRSNKRIKVDNKSPEIQEINENKGHGQDLISIGTVLTREQKVEYLSSLPQDVLVNLLLLAEQIEPNIPLYPANILGKYAAANMSSRDNEMVETNQNTREPTVDVQISELPEAETSNLSTLDTSPNLNPVNIDYAPPQVPRQDTQQEPITPEASPPLGGLKEITEHSKDSYLNLYIKAMSEIGNPNGSTAMTMHSWIKSNYIVPDNFATRAKKALNYAVSKGIFVKNSRMTYKFNPENSISHNRDSDDGNEPTAEEVKNIGVNVNNNNNNEYDGQKELTSEEEIPGIGKQNSTSEIKDFNFYPNQDFYFDLDPNFLGKGDDTYTATTQSQRSSISNAVAESNSNNPITDQYTSSDKASPPTQSQPVSKLSMNAQMLIENEQTLRLPPLAPKPSISVLPSIVRSNYQPSQELLNNSIGGGGNDISYSIIQQSQILSKKHILPLPRVNNNDNNITRNITTTTNISIAPNFSILTPAVIRGNQPQPPQQPQQMYDNSKIRTSSSSIPSLQSLPTIDSSLNGNVNKIRQQIIPLQTSTIHNTPTSIPTSPQQTWPSSFNPFYMSPQPSDTHYTTTIFENTFYDPASQSTQHQHHHTSTASTNDYNNAVLNDLQQHNDNGSLYHRMNGNQQDNNIIGDWDYRNM